MIIFEKTWNYFYPFSYWSCLVSCDSTFFSFKMITLDLVAYQNDELLNTFPDYLKFEVRYAFPCNIQFLFSSFSSYFCLFLSNCLPNEWNFYFGKLSTFNVQLINHAIKYFINNFLPFFAFLFSRLLTFSWKH